MTLPTPSPAFAWNREAWGDALRCRPLAAVADHVFTSKQLRLRPFESRHDEWAAAVHAVGGSLADLRRIRQVHGASVHRDRHGAPGAPPPAADAIVSNVAGRVLAVQVADCLPMLLADRRTGTAAAIHAGWRGTAARVTGQTIATLEREFGVRSGDLIVALGPAIGACCYQVGDELIEAFRSAGATAREIGRWFARQADGSLRLDIWTANVDQLVESGVAADRVHLAGLCTQSHASVFDSYRAEGAAAGRMAALVRVPHALLNP